MTHLTANRTTDRQLGGHLAMLAFSAAVSGSFSFGALVANDISPTALTVIRFALASLVLALVLSIVPGQGRHSRRGFALQDFQAPWRYAVLAVLYGGYFVLMFEALKTADPVASGAIFTLTPLMAAVFAWPLLAQRLSGFVTMTLILGALGAVWVIFKGDIFAILSLDIGRGEAVYFVACIFHALYAPMLKRLNRGETAMVTASLVTLAGFVVLGLYAWRDVADVAWADLPTRVWFVLAYLVVFATALASSALQYAAQRLPASKVMAYTYLTPVWIIGWELALGHGVPGLPILPGIALIVLALFMLMRRA